MTTSLQKTLINYIRLKVISSNKTNSKKRVSFQFNYDTVNASVSGPNIQTSAVLKLTILFTYIINQFVLKIILDINFCHFWVCRIFLNF